MTDANQLQRAYELIEADKLDEAREVLEPMVVEDNDDADAWWLYAHAVNDPEAARAAIKNVLRIDPEYPEAASLLSMLDQDTAAAPQPITLTQPPLRTIKPIGTTTAAAGGSGDDDTPDFSTDDDDDIDFDDVPEETEESKSPFPLPLPIMAAAAVVAIIIIGIIIAALLTPQGTPPEGEGTNVAMTTDEPTQDQMGLIATITPEGEFVEPSEEPVETEISGDTESEPTLEGDAEPTLEEGIEPTLEGDIEPTAEDNAEPTSEGAPTAEGAEPTAEGDGDALTSEAAEEQLIESLDDFTLPEDPIETTETDLGSTVIVTVCSTAEEIRTTAIEAMDAIANNSAAFSDVDALAVRINDCDTEAQLRLLGVSRQDAQDYAAGTLSDNEYQSSWQPLN